MLAAVVAADRDFVSLFNCFSLLPFWGGRVRCIPLRFGNLCSLGLFLDRT